MWRAIIDYEDADQLVLESPEQLIASFGEGFVRIGPYRDERGAPKKFTAEIWERAEKVGRIRIIDLDIAPMPGFPLD